MTLDSVWTWLQQNWLASSALAVSVLAFWRRRPRVALSIAEVHVAPQFGMAHMLFLQAHNSPGADPLTINRVLLSSRAGRVDGQRVRGWSSGTRTVLTVKPLPAAVLGGMTWEGVLPAERSGTGRPHWDAAPPGVALCDLAGVGLLRVRLEFADGRRSRSTRVRSWPKLHVAAPPIGVPDVLAARWNLGQGCEEASSIFRR